MNFGELTSLLTETFGEGLMLASHTQHLQPQLQVAPERLLEVTEFLKRHPSCYFDTLSCLTAIDNGPEKGTMEVIYHLYSIPFHHSLVLKIEIPRTEPRVESLSAVWRTAEWHEREAYDFFGITFLHHPDLRRILLPADWEGFPLRKDYTEQEYYHGIKVRY
ncbi:MAG: NADH-quinone oxidoreductase subunit C [Cytophagaceae bacterium]|jgi:NADH-quinone oxidoreductase subunit C|nr:NADH-quinone oxidoreductase subunit C [Cytophagaceae bacterium]